CIRYASSYNVPSIGAPTGVFVLPFGGVLASEGTPSAADVMRVDCKSRNLKSTDVAGVFQAYSALCSRGIGRRRSINVCQTTTVSSSNFIHDNDLCNTDPSTSRAVRNTRENPDVGLTSSEATCSRGIRGRPSVNVHQNTTVCSSNFIHDIDVRNTDPSIRRGGRNTRANPETRNARNTAPSTSRSGRNTRANPEVSLTTAEATYISGISRRRSVRRRPSTCGPTVGSNSTAGMGSLCPPPEEAPRFLQLYIYDTDNEVENRMRHFNRIHNSDLDPQMVEAQRQPDPKSKQVAPFIYVAAISPSFHNNGRADGRGRAKRVTMLAYYRYQLHFRLQQYDLIFKGGRLFQQYVVGYMMLFLEESAMKLGNLQFFITFTYNVNWPEIKRFMAQYPELTASDRADVVCPVFEQKIQSFVTFLKEERIFGNVT
ncbi:DNA helicase, partial [Tanacetum coccineum]